MVDILWATIAVSGGFLAYLLPAVFGAFYGPDTRLRIGNHYFDMWLRAFKRAALVKRMMGSYDLKRVTIDQEKPAAKVTFSTGALGDDQEEYFRDPDDRMKRLFNKPFFFFHEAIPAAVDLELAELGHWWHRHADAGQAREETETTVQHNGQSVRTTDVTVNPYFKVGKRLRAANLDDVIYLILFGSEPPDSKTMEHFTKKRFEKYGSKIGVAETVSTLMGFAVGVTAVAVIRYVNRNILADGGGGGAPEPVVPLGYIDVTPLVDLLGSGLV